MIHWIEVGGSLSGVSKIWLSPPTQAAILANNGVDRSEPKITASQTIMGVPCTLSRHVPFMCLVGELPDGELVTIRLGEEK